VISTQFTVLNTATGLPVSGLVAGDFTFRLRDPEGVDQVGTIAITVTELGTTGSYVARYTADAEEEWTLEIIHATYATYGLEAHHLVSEWLAEASDDATKVIRFHVVSTAGARVTGILPAAFSLALYNSTLAASAVARTFSELGTGDYQVAFDASSVEGAWYGIITHATHFPYGKRFVTRYHPTSVVAPSAPTMGTATNDGTGTSATIAVTANNAANRIYIRYRASSAAAWTTFATYRTGSGDVQVTGLGAYRYEFQALERSHVTGAWSLPSSSAFVTITSGSTAPAGPISLLLENLRTLLSNSPEFQSMVGAGDAGEAADSIYYPIVDSGSYERPCAILATDDVMHPAVATGLSSHFGESATLSMRIERSIDAGHQAAGAEESAYIAFANKVGQILLDVEALVGTSTYLEVRSLRVREIPRTPLQDETTDELYYTADVEVEVGVA
jgi:hypothetical protein